MTSKGKKARQREQRRKAARARARRRRTLIWSGIGGIAIVVIALLLFQPLPEELEAVETLPAQGRTHLAAGENPPEYNSNPATSGDHAPAPAQCGIYTEELPDVVQIHNLEHGAVAINYRSDLAADEIEALQQFARTKSSHVVVSPRADLTEPVVVTSWARMLRLDSVDIETIDIYFEEFVFSGPEVGVACPFAVDQGA